MSSYNMTSLHSKWSKQVAMPVGDRWGIPVGTSVADCLNWNYGAKPQPPTQPKSEVQLIKEETMQSRTYITRTPVPPAESADYSGVNSSLIRRAPNPTPGAALQKEVITSTSHTSRKRPPTPYLARTPKFETMEVVREAPTPDDLRDDIVVTPVPCTQKDIPRPQSAVMYSSTKLETPPSFREHAVNGTACGRRSPKKSIREQPLTPHKSFNDYLRERQRPQTPDHYKQVADYTVEKKFDGYPHYHASPTPEDIEFIVNQSQKAILGRTPTPGLNGSSRGVNPKYLINGHKSLVPASTDDIMKEKALIQAMREHLFDTQDQYRNLSNKPPIGRSPPKYRVSSRKEDTRISGYKPTRPHSTGNMEFYKAMYKNSPAVLKMVGFSPEDEYCTYDAYASRGGTPQLRDAWNDSADHFKEWRETTKALAKQGTPQYWKVNRYKNAKSKVDHKWTNGRPGSATPGKVSVELDCPDRSDMMVSVRVKNTPVPTY